MAEAFGREVSPLWQAAALEKGNKLVCMDEQCGYVKNKPTEEK